MMTRDEYREHLERLGMTVSSSRHLFGMGERSVRRFASGEMEVSRTVELLLRLMVKHNITPEQAMKLAVAAE